MNIKSDDIDAAQILITVNEAGYEIDIFKSCPLTGAALKNDSDKIAFECRDCEEDIDLSDLFSKIKEQLEN